MRRIQFHVGKQLPPKKIREETQVNVAQRDSGAETDCAQEGGG